MKTVYFPLFTTAQWIRTTHFYPADALMPFVVCVSASGSLNKQLWSCIGNCITVFCRYFTVSHYKCPLCDMTCPSPSALRNHIKFRHSNEKPYSCDCCEYRFYILCSILYQRKRLPLSYPFHYSVFFFFFLFQGVRIWSTCANTLIPTAASQLFTVTFPAAASPLVPWAPWNFTINESMRWKEG